MNELIALAASGDRRQPFRRIAFHILALIRAADVETPVYGSAAPPPIPSARRRIFP